MTAFDAVILGLVQGITEFLPISSSGHLVIAQKLLGVRTDDLVMDVVVHMGTFFSILTLYHGLVRRMCVAFFRPEEWRTHRSPQWRMAVMVVVASIPTALIGLAFKDQFEQLFNDMWSLGVCFIVTGGLLLLTRLKGSSGFSRDDLFSFRGTETITWWKALLIGTAQAVAIVPSISRSGTTIVAGILLGIPGPTAAMYSFVMSLPAIGGAAILELRHLEGEPQRFGILCIAFVTAYLSGLAGLWFTLQSVRRGRLDIFTIYLVVLGLFILWQWT